MKLSSILSVLLFLTVASQAAPLERRRFGQEHTPQADATFQEVKDIAQGSDKEAEAGNLSGAMVRALLAKAPACDQQDRADEVIDLGRKFGGDKEKQLIKVAQTYRQLERNTPNAGQPSELCKTPPRNKELNGLTQAQDPTGPKNNDPKPKEDPKKPKEKPKEDPKKPKENPKEDPKKPKENPKEDPKKPKENPKNNDPNNGSTNTAETNPVGGVKMPKIVKSNGDFLVNGVGFNGNLDAAHGRQCDIQHNLCFNKLNSGDKSFTNTDCDNQTNVCKSGPPVFA